MTANTLGEMFASKRGESPASLLTQGVPGSLSGEVITTRTQSNVHNATASNPWVPPEEPHRAVHRIRLSALTHNYHQVEAAASRQKCSVITVVKADGYGHGAIATALHLADHCGADAFAVATLEEGIALRQAFAANPPGQWSKQLAALFHTQHIVHESTDATASAGQPAYLTAPNSLRSMEVQPRVNRRPKQIRILVLGPPVGFPRCFDDYYHHNIEVMVSGPEVATSLLHWVADEAERKRLAVQRAANEAKFAALHSHNVGNMPPQSAPPSLAKHNSSVATATTEGASVSTVGSTAGSWTTATTAHSGASAEAETAAVPKKILPHPSSTLGNVQGADLAREVRSLLLHQHEAKVRHQHHSSASMPTSDANSVDSAGSNSDNLPPFGTQTAERAGNTTAEQVDARGKTANFAALNPSPTLFGGIEAAARSSRHSEAAAARARAIVHEDEEEDYTEHHTGGMLICEKPSNPTQQQTTQRSGRQSPPVPARKRLRWHALVDSGMGRLGFKSEIVSAHDRTGRRDTVTILKEMVDLELEGKAPLEFFGMCTHMADARDLSDYTNSQIGKFSALLKRVRAAGISVPTVSTDNSAALLTTSLKHFDPVQMLSQPGADTLGYVRTGGAIYGQRPAFKELQAVSTLLASVRHVAILKKGDTVGYDRAYVAPHDVRIATLTIGFADGYPRELGNGVGKVHIRGALFPVAGNVCMDVSYHPVFAAFCSLLCAFCCINERLTN